MLKSTANKMSLLNRTNIVCKIFFNTGSFYSTSKINWQYLNDILQYACFQKDRSKDIESKVSAVTETY